MSNFQYQARSSDQWDKRAKGSVYDGYALDSFNTFGPKKENTIRILPPTWPDPNHYGYDLWVHFGVGPNNGTVICLYKMGRGACPVCEAQARAEAAGRDDARDLKPTRRVLIWLVDRKDEQEKREKCVPALWAMPWTVDRDISKICRDRVSGQLYQIDHPDSGFDLFFDKEGEGVTTKYTGFQLARNQTTVEQRYLDFIIANPLPSVLMWRDYDEVKALFEGQAPPAEKSSFNTPLQSSQQAPPPPAPVQQQQPASVAPPPPPPPPVSVFPPEGWTLHPSAPGYYYKGQEVVSEGDLRARTATGGNGHASPPPPAPVTSSPEPAKEAPAVAGTSRAAQMRQRFETGTGTKK